MAILTYDPLILLLLTTLGLSSIFIPPPVQKQIGRLEKQAVLGLFCGSAVFHLAAALVKGRIEGVEILAVQLLLRDAEGVGKTINME